MYSYEQLPEYSLLKLAELCVLAHQRLIQKQSAFNSYPHWTVIVNELYTFKLNPLNECENTIAFMMDSRLLGAILEKKIHWNNAEVGCHIAMDRIPNEYDPDIHTLMCFFHI